MGMNISFKAGRLFEGRICVTPRQIHDYLGSFPAGGTIQI